ANVINEAFFVVVEQVNIDIKCGFQLYSKAITCVDEQHKQIGRRRIPHKMLGSMDGVSASKPTLDRSQLKAAKSRTADFLDIEVTAHSNSSKLSLALPYPLPYTDASSDSGVPDSPVYH
ncbi:MAG: hypothetical protein WBC68_06480, partial [Albidovulum sp.]